jgi:hypothetical protein
MPYFNELGAKKVRISSFVALWQIFVANAAIEAWFFVKCLRKALKLSLSCCSCNSEPVEHQKMKQQPICKATVFPTLRNCFSPQMPCFSKLCAK